MINGFDSLVALSKDNVEAVVKSSTATVKGFEDLAKAYAGFAGASIEKANAGLRALAAVKSPQEFAQVQSQLSREAIESAIIETRKFAEAATAVVNSAVEPLTARFNVVASTFKPSFG